MFVIKSNGKKALISGDVLHHPCQIVYPDWETTFDTDPKQAVKLRLKILNDVSDGKTLFIGSHFAAPTAGYVKRDGNSFVFSSKI